MIFLSSQVDDYLAALTLNRHGLKTASPNEDHRSGVTMRLAADGPERAE